MPKAAPKNVKGIPLPVWIGAGLFAIVVGYFFLRTNNQKQQTDLQGAAGATDQQTIATETYAAFLNQSSWLNSYLAEISQQLAGIASTQGASAPPNPSPPPKPPPGCCPTGKMKFPCHIGWPPCPPSPHHDGSGIISPAYTQ